MTETRANYLVQSDRKRDILSADADEVREQLRNMRRDLRALLLTVERALGEEPSIVTRAERRRGQMNG